MTANCDQFCTVVKCIELENRIAVLEQDLTLLKAAFEAHTNQKIPDAHDYDFDIKIDGSFHAEQLTLTVAGGGASDTAQIPIPIPTDYVTQTEFNNHLNTFIPDAHDYDFDIKIDGSFHAEQLTLTVAGGGASDTAQIPIPIPTDYVTQTEFNNHLNTFIPDAHDYDFDIKIDGSFHAEQLTLTVAGGGASDTAQIPIPLDESNFVQLVNNYYTNNYGDNNVDCENKIENCCNEILDKLTYVVSEIEDSENNLKNEIDNLRNLISQDLQIIENYVTVDISGQTNNDYKCLPVLDENQEPTGEKTANFTLTNYSGVGLIGLHENLKLINQNLSSIYSDLCAINYEPQDYEPQDVVAIVASEKDLHRVKTKVLILHFVLLDVYPKRSASDTLWQIQIPAAKDSYSWFNDFDGLRRTHGNQYAELQFNENYVPVSGWFASEAAAETFFDAVLELTNATEKNRVFPKHKTPQINITVATTRPYRAFIKSINLQGRPVCHAKYVPVINE